MQWIKQKYARIRGHAQEQRAKHYLMAQGLHFVCANYQCKGGEIDLVMRDNDEWVFVEVKYRKRADYGNAWDYFHQQKRKRFTKALLVYLAEQGLNANMEAHRIDLVAIQDQHVTWFKGI